MIPPAVPLVSGPLEWAFVGFVVGVLFPFVLLALLRRLSTPDGADESDVVGPHVVRPVRKLGNSGTYLIYQCKYCGKERERKGFFVDEDCGEFEA